MMAAPFYSSRSVEVPGTAVPYQLLLMCVLSTVAFLVDTGTLLLECAALSQFGLDDRFNSIRKSFCL